VALRLETEASPACLDAVHELLAQLWAQRPDAGADARARFTTAVAELVANVVEHGRTAAGRPPRLVLSLAAAPGAVVADLEDDGIEVPPVPPAPGDPLAESGRGVALAAAAVDELSYARADGRNRWHVVLRA
jgi:serine/threonine-protein kinase RsbW